MVVNVACKHSRIKQYLKRRPGDAHQTVRTPRPGLQYRLPNLEELQANETPF